MLLVVQLQENLPVVVTVTRDDCYQLTGTQSNVVIKMRHTKHFIIT